MTANHGQKLTEARQRVGGKDLNMGNVLGRPGIRPGSDERGPCTFTRTLSQ